MTEILQLYEIFGARSSLSTVISKFIDLYKECGQSFTRKFTVFDTTCSPDYKLAKMIIQEYYDIRNSPPQAEFFKKCYLLVVQKCKEELDNYPHLHGLRVGIEEATDLMQFFEWDEPTPNQETSDGSDTQELPDLEPDTQELPDLEPETTENPLYGPYSYTQDELRCIWYVMNVEPCTMEQAIYYLCLNSGDCDRAIDDIRWDKDNGCLYHPIYIPKRDVCNVISQTDCDRTTALYYLQIHNGSIGNAVNAIRGSNRIKNHYSFLNNLNKPDRSNSVSPSNLKKTVDLGMTNMFILEMNRVVENKLRHIKETDTLRKQLDNELDMLAEKRQEFYQSKQNVNTDLEDEMRKQKDILAKLENTMSQTVDTQKPAKKSRWLW
jgi:hypothetical protein